MKQGGTLELAPRQAAAMGYVALHFTEADVGRIRIALQDGKELIGNYDFQCPLP